jgi:ATP-dependent Lon protease
MTKSKKGNIVLPLLPLRELLVFPHTVVPLFVGREKSIKALDEAMSKNREIFLAAQKQPKSNDPRSDEIFDFGTVAHILQLLRLPDGTVKILVEGKNRARISKHLESQDMMRVEISQVEEEKSEQIEVEALIRSVKQAFDTYVKLNKKIPPEMVFSIARIEDESRLADTLVVQLSNLKLAEKQKILETINPAKRLEEIFGIIQAEIEILRVEKKIRARVKRQMEKTQKEYYLNEQISAIQKELGNVDDIRAEIIDIEARAKKKVLSQEAAEKLRKEIKKLRSMSPMSSESTVVRNYIDTLLALPWGDYATLIKDAVYSEDILNKDHFGLEKVKDRILEHLAVTSLNDSINGPILCLVGPPGVGKTSLARSIARETGRDFTRISLGGVKDEAEIRGHRRTYIGAMPGKIINSLKKTGHGNTLLLLDEIDKLSSDVRGDPSSALLEVLDPEQNTAFNDHYLDLDYDLSKVMFIATANSVSTIPKPLLDRMELISLGGYTEQEKIQIAEKHLVKKVAKSSGLENLNLTFQLEAIEEIVRYYTREAGVRSLERSLSSICRKIARSILKDKAELRGESSSNEDSHQDSKPNKDVICLDDVSLSSIDTKCVEKYLGPRKFSIGEKESENIVGTCQGLAYTDVGGELLVAEVATMSGKGNLKVTGKLGEVMQESAQAAFSYIRSRASFLGLSENFYSKIEIHVHFPEGAVPKDGPSAGITIATALVSALTQKPVSRHIAMTGEITLRGRVLPIGGLKEKILAAHRGAVKKVIIPKENEKDLIEIPDNVLKNIEVIPVEHMDDVLLHALVWEDSDGLYTRLKDEKAFVISTDGKSKPRDQFITH